MKTTIKVGPKRIDVHENIFDRAVRFFDPVRGQKRFRARAMTALAGGYSSASKSKRSLSEWKPLGNDADTDLLPDLPTLRERSRDLVRNSPLAAGAINTACTSVIGSGLHLKSEIDGELLGLTDDQAQEWERSAERLHSLWANSRDCDITRTQTFAEMEDLVFRSTLESGDIFSLLPNRKVKGSLFDLRVQLVEADRVENKDFSNDTPTQAGGIKMDTSGAPIEYHILKSHPGNNTAPDRSGWDIPAFGQRTGRRNVLHHFRRVRPGQNRGVPYLAPVIEALKQLERYTEAELMAAVVSGMFTVFLKTEGDEELDVFEPSSETGGAASDDDFKLGNGAMVQLGTNDSIDTANPGRPNSGFDPFVMSILRQVGVALEMPYEVLIKHFTASYSASRAALLEAWRFFLTRRTWLASSFCQPVYEAFIDEQVAEGRLAAPGYFSDPIIRAAYLGSRWIGRPQGQIDPKKENEADAIAEDRGWKTAEQNTIEKTGGDWLKNHKQRTKEVSMRKADGLEQEQVANVPGNTDTADENENNDKPETGDEDT